MKKKGISPSKKPRNCGAKIFRKAVGFNPNPSALRNHTHRPGYHGSSPARLTGKVGNRMVRIYKTVTELKMISRKKLLVN